jgi:predicted pyridoxine 5'-phosphate oxidase superfamily flavin-nucleotide-binding protein
MDAHDIDSLAGLRDLYGPLPEAALAKRIVFPQLHRHHRAFIALSPFIVVASADRDGSPDVCREATCRDSSPC